jgi:hypothetical protein
MSMMKISTCVNVNPCDAVSIQLTIAIRNMKIMKLSTQGRWSLLFWQLLKELTALLLLMELEAVEKLNYFRFE